MKRIIVVLIFISFAAYTFPRYTDNNDGTVKDNSTGLIWQKCSFGQTYSGTTCSGTATVKTWKDSLAYCATLTLAGKSWRLPNINELKSIIDQTKFAPSIHKGFFPNTKSNSTGEYAHYWSSTTYFRNIREAWSVDFCTGDVMDDSKIGTLFVRCVAGP